MKSLELYNHYYWILCEALFKCSSLIDLRVRVAIEPQPAVGIFSTQSSQAPRLVGIVFTVATSFSSLDEVQQLNYLDACRIPTGGRVGTLVWIHKGVPLPIGVPIDSYILLQRFSKKSIL